MMSRVKSSRDDDDDECCWSCPEGQISREDPPLDAGFSIDQHARDVPRASDESMRRCG